MDDSDPESFNVQEEDIIIGSKVKFNALEKRGFKPISSEKFDGKVKTIFGIDLKNPEQCKFLHSNDKYVIYVTPNSIIETDEARVGGIGDFQRDNFYFFKNKNFMTFRIPLMIGSIEEKHDGTSEIVAWDDEYYRNKFLFNDDQASLTWLFNNDMDFLETLVRVFGYDKNDTINKKVLNAISKKYNRDTENDYEQLACLFARRDCKGDIEIRSGLIKTITSNTTVKDNALLTMLEEYLSAIIDDEKTLATENVQRDFTKSERIKIFTIIGYQVQKIYFELGIESGFQNWAEASVFYNQLADNDNLLDEIKKEQYYKIPEIEETIKKTMKVIAINNEMEAER